MFAYGIQPGAGENNAKCEASDTRSACMAILGLSTSHGTPRLARVVIIDEAFNKWMIDA